MVRERVAENRIARSLRSLYGVWLIARFALWRMTRSLRSLYGTDTPAIRHTLLAISHWPSALEVRFQDPELLINST